ncbi:hypothetical protein [Candidatus Uabimicrobium sp. HlEnr_7]|uniref:hypothetical protein n=1 Tax=Candidatus Uabimicrobium helgolandensis TaxID=3095367 RepID=UPI003558EB8A
MRKVLFVVIVVVLLALGFYSISGSTDYDDFLPEKALMTFTFNSPVEFLQKLPVDDFPDMVKGISQQGQSILGKDIFTREFYMGNGIDPRKTIGVSVCSQTSAAVFFGIHDSAKFIAFLKEKMGRSAEFTEQNIAGLDCTIIKEIPFSSRQTLYTSIGNYGVIYVSFERGMKSDGFAEKFTEEIASQESRLGDSDSFKRCEKELKNKGDFFMHLNYQHFAKMYESMAPAELKQIMKATAEYQNDTIAYAGTFSLNENICEVRAYNDYVADSNLLESLKSNSSCRDLVAAMPKSPLAFSTVNVNANIMWKMYKKMVNAFFAAMPNMQGQSIDQILQEANKIAREELGVTVDVEKDFIHNIKGNLAGAIYSLPSNIENIDFNVVVGAKLVDPEKFRGVFDSIVNTVNEKQPFAKPLTVENSSGWVIDVEAFQPPQPIAITPTIVFFQDYILFTSKQQIAQDIVKSVNAGDSLVDNIKNASLRSEVENGGMLQFYVDLDTLLTQALQLIPELPTEQFLPLVKRFDEIRSTSQVRTQGAYGDLAIQTDENFVKSIVLTVMDVQKIQMSNPFEKALDPKKVSMANLRQIGKGAMIYQLDFGKSLYFPNSLEALYTNRIIVEPEAYMCPGNYEEIVPGKEDPSFVTNYKWLMSREIYKHFKSDEINNLILAYSDSFSGVTLVLFADGRVEERSNDDLKLNELFTKQLSLLKKEGIDVSRKDGIR